MKLPASIESLREKIDGLPLRQRALLALAMVAATYAIFDTLMIRPQSERLTSIQNQLERSDSRTAEFNASIERLAANVSTDPNIALRQQLSRIQSRIEQLEADLAEFGGVQTLPDDALAQLRQLLAPGEAIRLRALEKLPPEALVVEGSDRATAYVHRFKLVVEAAWNPALDYLKAVEALPSGLYLDRLRLLADESATNQIELTLFTISLGEGWLDV